MYVIAFFEDRGGEQNFIWRERDCPHGIDQKEIFFNRYLINLEMIKQIDKAIFNSQNLVKFLAIIWLLLPMLVNGQNSPITRKTNIYYQYQIQNAFKGIRFGSTFSEAKGKLLLAKYYQNSYKINNSAYLIFNDIQFSLGVAYFTPQSGKLYQIVLYKNCKSYSDCLLTYQHMKISFINLFGENDAEYVESPSDAKVQGGTPARNISWYGEVGINMSINSSSDNYSIEISIDNGNLNSIATDEQLKLSKSTTIPKI